MLVMYGGTRGRERADRRRSSRAWRIPTRAACSRRGRASALPRGDAAGDDRRAACPSWSTCRRAARSPTAARCVIDACRAALPPPVAVGPAHEARCIRLRRDRGRRVPHGPALPGLRASGPTAQPGGPLGRCVGRASVSHAADAAARSRSTSSSATGCRASACSRRAAVQALRGVSFTLQAGRSLGVVGESGSGKSTLARLVMALERAERGPRALLGRDLHALRARRAAAARARLPDGVPGSVRLARPAPDASAASWPSRSPRMARRAEQRDARRPRSLDAVGLRAGDAGKYPHEFSGGQRQRIAIARALITRPRADRRRRAGERARRLGAGPGAEPAAGPAGPLRRHLPLHQPRPRGGRPASATRWS